MDQQNQPRYTDFQLFLGITAGMAAGAIAGTLIATSIAQKQQKNRPALQPEDWQKYFSFFNRAAKTVMRDIPQLFHELSPEPPPPPSGGTKTPHLKHRVIEEEEL